MMTDLLNPGLWTFELPWGTSPEGCLMNMQQECVKWQGSQVSFSVQKKWNTGWYMDDNWQRQERSRGYQAGFIVSKEKYLYGKFTMKCQLPSFVRAWPAWWLFIEDEIDMMEIALKSRERKHLATSYLHHGNETFSAERRFCLPITRTEHTWSCVWTPTLLQTQIDGKDIMKITDTDLIPCKPMTLICGSGIGDWGDLEEPFDLFTVKSMTYE